MFKVQQDKNYDKKVKEAWEKCQAAAAATCAAPRLLSENSDEEHEVEERQQHEGTHHIEEAQRDKRSR